MKVTVLHITLVFTVALLHSCKDDDNPPPAAPASPTCIISTETTNNSSGAWLYEYDADGNPLKISLSLTSGTPAHTTIDIFYNSLKITGKSSSTGKPVITFIQYDADLFLNKIPTMAQVSLTIDDVTQFNYKQYHFFYDDKNRLIKIGMQTIYVGDWEWDLDIFYNQNDNVTGLQAVWTTGPNEVIAPITVTAYDDKPTPLGPSDIWKFLLPNFSYENASAELITALSKNNPLDFKLGDFKRTMTYKYNEQGFPIQRFNTNSNPNGEITYTQTFTYTCK